MLSACIDIGSNTTRLLVARTEGGQLQEVMQQRAFTRLGGDGAIGSDKTAAVAAAVAGQVRAARGCGVERLRAVGTHAIRQAPDRERLLAAIEREAGVRVDVLSGEEEAAYAFRGATRMVDGDLDGEVGVVDVGGGSTELVCGTVGEGPSWSVSYAIGSGVLADAHLHSDPPSDAELEGVRERVREVFADCRPPRPRAAFAVGGSATSLCRMAGSVLDREALERAVGLLCGRPSLEVAQHFDLHPERARLLPAGILVLAAAGELFDAPLQVAQGGLREGVLLGEPGREGH